MKQLFLTVCLLALSCASFGQKPDDIVGVWLTAERNGKIEIYKSGSQYFGKLIWGQKLYEADGKTVKRDVKNPDEALRGRSLLNLVILSGFVYDDGEWRGGKVYDPQSGKTYSSNMHLNEGRLELRGYIGIPAFGKTTVWTRVRQ